MKRYNRRNFLSKMGLGATLLTVAMPSNVQSQPHIFDMNQTTKKLGVALVGLGSYSEHQLAPALKQAKNCYLSAIVTGTPAKKEKWKQNFGLKDSHCYDYTTFDKIAKNPDVDVVYVVLPNSMHHEYVLRAAKAGKHVIVEKPMGLTVKESEEMIAACKQAGVKLFVGYRLHYQPHTLEVMKFAKELPSGKIKIVESSMGFRIGDPNQWRLKKSLAGGGAMMDVGIYAIQGARYATGEEPTHVTAQEFKTDPVKFKEVDETIIWQMEFPSGAICNAMTSYATSIERLYVGAERGYIELRPAFGYGPLKGRTNAGELDVPVYHHQTAQMEAFAAAIIDNRDLYTNGEEGLRDMKVIEAVYRAVKSGKREKI
jgi:predicted dehydrogenase